MASIIASGHRCPWFISQHFQKNSDDKIVEVAEVNQVRFLEESGQWLENVDQTQLVMASQCYKNYQF